MRHKLRFLFVIILISLGCSFPVHAQFPFAPDSAYFGVFLVDADSMYFTRGAILTREHCGNCDTTTIPLNTTFQEPIDEGHILFTYSADTDSIFAGEIIWAGSGDILYPHELLPADSFANDFTPEPEPQSVVYWDVDGNPTLPDSMKAKADTAWQIVSTLIIIHEFTSEPYHLGLYYYTPSAGSDQIEGAKWVVFVFRDRVTTGLAPDDSRPDQHALQGNYPNPFNPQTNIQYQITRKTHVRLDLYNSAGNTIATLVDRVQESGTYTVPFIVEGFGLSSGVYFYRLATPGFTETGKMVYLK